MPAAEVVNAAAGGGHVDSIFPIEEELRRFRSGLREVAALGPGAAMSRDELVRRFVDALARADAAALAAMHIDRSEFAWLYYPHTIYTRRPYELTPALLWFQMTLASEKGAAHALRWLGGRPVGLHGYRCGPRPERQHVNRIWSHCELQIGSGADTLTLPLSGGILERAGRFKFLSYSIGM